MDENARLREECKKVQEQLEADRGLEFFAIVLERDKWREVAVALKDADIIATNNSGRRQWHGSEIGWIPAGMSVIMIEAEALKKYEEINVRILANGHGIVLERDRLREEIVRLEQGRIVEFCGLQNENARLREMIENLRNVCTTENESKHDLANRILHILSNVRDQQAPLASGATPGASKDRDRSPGGTGLCCIALFAFLFL